MIPRGGVDGRAAGVCGPREAPEVRPVILGNVWGR